MPGGRDTHAAAAPGARLGTVLVLLAFGSGAADAFAFLLLGGIFTANMTGNLVLLGMFTRPGWLVTVAGAATALVVFAAAAFTAFRASPEPVTGTTYPPRASRRLALASVTLQVGLLVAWAATRGHVGTVGACGMIALSAAALGTQTVLAKRISGASGVTTTFVTGTLTSLVEELAARRPGVRLVQLMVVLALLVGAVTGTALVHAAPLVVPLLPLVTTGSALVVLTRDERRGPRARSA